MKVKRWLLLFILGIILVSSGFTVVINIGILNAIENFIVYVLHFVTDNAILASPMIGGIIIITLGIMCIIVGIRGVVRSIVTAVYPCEANKIVDLVHENRQLGRGPNIVVIGGGTGLSVLLRGLKMYTSNISAVVTVADNGGSSGRLRNEWGVLPPGDIRNCLVALANTEPLMEKLFQYRFERQKEFKGHSFGNLFIATMSEVVGDFEKAVRESSKVLAIRGEVVPSTLQNVALVAELDSGEIVRGESQITNRGQRIVRVFLEPEDVKAPKSAIEAIRNAEAIVLGPGSLYTSVLPNLLVPEVADAIIKSKAAKVYVCNIMTQHGETDNYKASDHVKAIIDHTDKDILKYVVVNKGRIPSSVRDRYKEESSIPVDADISEIAEMGYTAVSKKLSTKTQVLRHDSDKLARTILEVIKNKKLHDSLVYKAFSNEKGCQVRKKRRVK